MIIQINRFRLMGEMTIVPPILPLGFCQIKFLIIVGVETANLPKNYVDE